MVMLSACSNESNYAPVTEINVIEPLPQSGMHRVMPGETLYEVAWRYGLDYRDLAKNNHILPPYSIKINDRIFLQRSPSKVGPEVGQKNLALHREKDQPVSKWSMPANGKIIENFLGAHKGINIAGRLGDPIYAAAAGKVVYSGNGLRSYGNLIIIKHNHLYLSAYAHNHVVFVKEGDHVYAGQKIAEMGNKGTHKTMLHFEIRRAGKPVNPLRFLLS